nr:MULTISPECIES: hypothetical protein [Rhodococcus]
MTLTANALSKEVLIATKSGEVGVPEHHRPRRDVGVVAPRRPQASRHTTYPKRPSKDTMRDLTYFVGITIDGFIAGPDGDIGFFPMHDDILGFVAQEYPETIPTHLREKFGVDGANKQFDTVIQGRATYEPALAVGITSPYAHLRNTSLPAL